MSLESLFSASHIQHGQAVSGIGAKLADYRAGRLRSIAAHSIEDD